MHSKLLHIFFSNNKALLSTTRTSYIIVEKNSIRMLLGYGYMRKNLVRLGEYPTHRDAVDLSNPFYFYFVFI